MYIHHLKRACLVLILLVSICTGLPIHAESLEDFDYGTYIKKTEENKPHLFSLLYKLTGYDEKTGKTVKNTSRVTGYQDCIEAADLIEQELKAILGDDNVNKDEFELPVPVQKEAYITVNGQKTDLRCLWPNVVRVPSSTILKDVPISYIGNAKYAQMDGKPIKGSIVIVDFDCESDFIEAVKLGARAIIFVPSDIEKHNDRYEASKKIVSNNMDIPRFFMERKSIEKLYNQIMQDDPVLVRRNLSEYSQTVSLQNRYHNSKVYAAFNKQSLKGRVNSIMLWEKRKGFNYYGFIKGRGFKGFHAAVDSATVTEDEETIIKLAPDVILPPIYEGAKVFFTSGPRAGKNYTIDVEENTKHSVTIPGMLNDIKGAEFTIKMDFEECSSKKDTFDKGSFETIKVKSDGEGEETVFATVLLDKEADFFGTSLNGGLKVTYFILFLVIAAFHTVVIVKSKKKALFFKALIISLAVVSITAGIIYWTITLKEKHLKEGELFVRFTSGKLENYPGNPFLVKSIDNQKVYIDGNIVDLFSEGDSYILERKLTVFKDIDTKRLRGVSPGMVVNFHSGKLKDHPGNPFVVTAQTDNLITIVGDVADKFSKGDTFRLEEKGAMAFFASYDTMSVVPDIAPGAEQTGGLLALLNLAKVLKEKPPARDVVIAVISGRYEGLTGVREFASRHCWDGHKDVVIKNEDPYLPINFDMAFGIDLNSHGSRIGLCPEAPNTPFVAAQYKASNFDELKKALGSYAEAFTKTQKTTCLVENMKNSKDISLTEKMAFRQACFTTPILKAGNRAAVLSSFYTNREWEDTPFDTVEHMNLENLARQIADLTAVMAQCLDDPYFFSKAPAKKVRDAAVMVEGSTYYFDKERNFMPSTPVPYSLVMAVNSDTTEPTYCGVRYGYFKFSDRKGKFRFYGYDYPWASFRAYKLNERNGTIFYSTDFGKDGDGTYPIRIRTNHEQDKTAIVVLFNCTDVNVYDLYDPRFYKVIRNVAFLNSDNVMPKSWGKSPGFEGVNAPYATLFCKGDERIKVIGRRGVFGIQYLVPGNEPYKQYKSQDKKKTAAEGIGIVIPENERVLLTSYDVAKAMSILNSFRINLLNKFGIKNREMEELSDFAINELKSADTLRSEKNYTGYQRKLHAAIQAASKVYPQIHSTTNDSLRGVIFYFAMIIPFAYFLERLLFGFPQIIKQIMAVVGIFLCVFFIFRWVHPVFQITETPYIILLAFILLALSAFVTVFVIRKFNTQMAEMKRKAAKIHHSDVQRLGATVAAIRLGISNMRNRKVRTSLTIITLILLTFIVLSFVSISSRSDFYKISISDQPIYDGFLVRGRGWTPLSDELFNSIKFEFAHQKDVKAISPRYWYFEGKKGVSLTEPLKLNIFLNSKGTRYEVKGVVGMGPDEDKVTNISRYLKYGSWFSEPPGDEESCIISSYMAEKLGFSEDELKRISEIATRVDEVGKDGLNDSEREEIEKITEEFTIEVYGRAFWIKGVFDSNRFDNLVDIDDESVTPIDPSSVGVGGRATNISVEVAELKAAQATSTTIKPAKHLSPDSVIFIRSKEVKRFGGTLRSIGVSCIDSSKGHDYVDKVTDFLKRVGIIIFVSNDGKSKAFTPKMSTGMEGFANILVPLIIAAMIVLNTMMGAVHERHDEIHTYSSVGLAPKHIGALFLAESIVYSVVGGVSGFLIGQVLAKVVYALGWLQKAGIELNYSSTATVFSIMLIMVVVLLSTIYPARMASRLSVPDVTRRWKLVPPETDNWVFDFPFTVPHRGVEGIIVFLNNYFEGYKEESIGSFYTDNVMLSKKKTEHGQGFVIGMRIWIAPFDMGVSQMTELQFMPTEDTGVMKIVLDITRVTGEQKTWVRLNKGFLGELRKQFLIWRTISAGQQDDYTELGKKMLSQNEEINGE